MRRDAAQVDSGRRKGGGGFLFEPRLFVNADLRERRSGGKLGVHRNCCAIDLDPELAVAVGPEEPITLAMRIEGEARLARYVCLECGAYPLRHVWSMAR